MNLVTLILTLGLLAVFAAAFAALAPRTGPAGLIVRLRLLAAHPELGKVALRQLRDKRAGVWADMQDIRSQVDKDGWTAELRESWDKADGELTELTGDIERAERDDELTQRFDEIDAGDPDVTGGNRDAGQGDDADRAYREAFTGYLRSGLTHLPTEQRQMLEERFVTEQRAQGVATGAAGGYTVPEGFWAKVTETMKFYAPVAQVAEVLTTSTGNKIPWPTSNDTGNEGALLDENTATTELELTFGQAMIEAFTFTSRLVLVSLQLLQDNAVDIDSFVARKLGERLGRVTNRYYTVGTGTDEPQGYIAGATVGKTAAAQTSFTWEELVDLQHSVDVAYRANGRFALHDLVLAQIRKMKDDEQRPLWQPAIAAGVPDMILGHPYFVNNYQASAVAASAKTVAFGDFRAGFVVREVQGAQLMRLAERYAEKLQVGFHGFTRGDSVVQDASAIKVLQQAAAG